jgi:hypothetical protein
MNDRLNRRPSVTLPLTYFRLRFPVRRPDIIASGSAVQTPNCYNFVVVALFSRVLVVVIVLVMVLLEQQASRRFQ